MRNGDPELIWTGKNTKLEIKTWELFPFTLALFSDLALSSCTPSSLEGASSPLPGLPGVSPLLVIFTMFSQVWAAGGRGGLAARLLLTCQVDLLLAFDLKGVSRMQCLRTSACLT